MASITIRKLDDLTKRRLRMRAAQNGRSMEEEARATLVKHYASDELAEKAVDGSWVDRIVSMFQEIGGAELEPLPRQPVREPPDFSKW